MTDAPDGRPDDAAPTGVDALIAQLGEGGAVESEGHFTLDRDVAREKLQQYRLAEPLRFVLELVRSLVQRGAERIAVRVSAGNIWLQADGRAFGQRDFDRLWNALLDAESGPGDRSLESLAMALNSALALPLAFIEVVSTGAEVGARLTVRPRLPDDYGALKTSEAEALERPSGWDPVTTIHVRRAGGAGLLARAVRHTLSDLPVEALLRQGCLFATTRIELNGALVSQGAGATDRLGVTPLESGACRGSGWHSEAAADEALLHLVADDVRVCTQPLIGLPPHYEAMVRCDDFTLDLSRESVVKDDRYQAALDLARHGWDAAIATLVEEQADTSRASTRAPAWVMRRLRSAFRARFTDADAGLPPDATPLQAALRHAYLWPLATGEGLDRGLVMLTPSDLTATYDALATGRVENVRGCVVADSTGATTFSRDKHITAADVAVLVDDKRDQLHLEGLLGDRGARLPTVDPDTASYSDGEVLRSHSPARRRSSQATGILVAIIAFILFVLWLAFRMHPGG